MLFSMNLSIRISVIYRFLTLSVLLLISSAIQANGITTGIDEQAKLPYWQYKNDEILVRFIQRLPDQTRGYFMARGFSAKHTELVANSCVFQTIFRNVSDKSNPTTIDYDMKNWHVIQKQKISKLKTREDWALEWQKLNVAVPAKLAFNWGLLPTTQHYQPGDYNWGMATFNLSSGSYFDLKLSWVQANKKHSVIFPKMQCAADVHLDPEG